MSTSRAPDDDGEPLLGTRRQARERALALLYEAEAKGCTPAAVLAGLPVDRTAAALSKPDRQKLVGLMKRLRLPLKGTLGFEKAEVTAGGVALDEVDSRSMCSKKVPELFIAGEVLDLDGPIGGYNFQAAWSTGWLAGTRAAEM